MIPKPGLNRLSRTIGFKHTVVLLTDKQDPQTLPLLLVTQQWQAVVQVIQRGTIGCLELRNLCPVHFLKEEIRFLLPVQEFLPVLTIKILQILAKLDNNYPGLLKIF